MTKASGKPLSDREKTARLQRLLKSRHLGGNGSNGEAWSYFEEVRNQTGFSGGQIRTMDAVAMSLWPSRGLLLHGFEIKAGRADWLRELRDPGKSECFIRHCDHWWLVAEPDVVEDGELPNTWGLLVRRGSKLVQKVAAPQLEPEPVTPTFLAALLRSAGRDTEVTPEQITEAESSAREHLRKLHEGEVEYLSGELKNLREDIAAFKRESGLALRGRYPKPWTPGELGAAVKLVLEGEAKAEIAEQRLRQVAETAERLASSAREVLPSEVAA